MNLRSHRWLGPLAIAANLAAQPAQAAPDLAMLGELTPLSAPVELRVVPGWQSACTLRQQLESEQDERAQQVVTFDTHVEGDDQGPILVQIVKGYGESDPGGTPLYGYEHRMTMNARARPISAEAKAIDGFPIPNAALREAAQAGRVDIRDAIFSGRLFHQNDVINPIAEETFRFLKPVIQRGTRVGDLVHREDRSRVVGSVFRQGRLTLVVAIDVTATTARRAGVTDITVAGWLLIDRESGLIAGERWTAKVLKTGTEPFDLQTEISCVVRPHTARDR